MFHYYLQKNNEKIKIKYTYIDYIAVTRADNLTILYFILVYYIILFIQHTYFV